MRHSEGSYVIYYLDVNGDKRGYETADCLIGAEQQARVTIDANEMIDRAVLHRVIKEIK